MAAVPGMAGGGEGAEEATWAAAGAGETTTPTNWDLVERNCRRENERARAREDAALRADYEADEALLVDELDEAVAAYDALAQQLLAARRRVEAREADVAWLADGYRRRVDALAAERADSDAAIGAWIARGRAAAAGAATAAELATAGSAAAGSAAAGPAGAEAHAIKDAPDTPDAPGAPDTPDAPIGPFGAVEVFHADGQRVGHMARIQPPNRWVQILLGRPIVRSVQVRAGRKIAQADLDVIAASSDAKRSKWLAFFIQATGSLQHRACHTCTRGQGLFSLCIIVGGADFPRCGNCEWNKHGCHGASGVVNLKLSRPGSLAGLPLSGSAGRCDKGAAASVPPLAAITEDTNTNTSINKPAGKGHSVVVPPTTAPAVQSTPPPRPGTADDAPEGNEPHLPEITRSRLCLKDDGLIFLEPEIMYGVPLRKIGPGDAYWQPIWKPIEAAIQSKHDAWLEKLTALKAVPDATLTDRDRTAIFQAGRQVNRGKATLKFLASADFHPFQLVGKQWITPSLAHYDTLFRMVTTLTELAKFRLDVSPLQWLRQRLHEIYEDRPSAFKLDRVVAKLYHDPKLTHLRLKNGFGNIGRPQVHARTSGGTPAAAAASKGSGGGSSGGDDADKPTIGEKRKSAAADDRTPTPAKRPAHGESARKRAGGAATSRPATPATTPAKAAAVRASPLPPPAPPPPPPVSASSPLPPTPQQPPLSVQRSPTRAKHHDPPPPASAKQQQNPPKPKHGKRSVSAAAGPPAADDGTDSDDGLAYAGYTSTDSLTHDTVIRKDWRVYQVKTAQLTTNPHTTQYWHWVDEKDADPSEPMFEHQVLKEMEPATSWGVFKEPIDFHLRLRELTAITYARGSRIVVIGTRPIEGVEERGNVLALFKRERTKRRFLAFMRKKGVGLVRVSSEAVEEEWDCIQSDMMPGSESD